MVKIVIVGKFGESKTLNVSNLNLEKLYKKCNFRKKDYFSKRHTWTVKKENKSIYIHLYAKNSGRPATINKFELPPPVDKDLFYGAFAIVASTDKDCVDVVDVTHIEWEKMYIGLMGGFEDLDSEEGERSSDEYIPPELKTKQGYSKENNFIVEDGDELEFLSSEEPTEDEYEFDEDENTTSNTDVECLGDDEVSSNKSNADTVQEEGEDEEEGEDKEEDEEDEEDNNDGDDEFEQGDSELTEEEYVKEN